MNEPQVNDRVEYFAGSMGHIERLVGKQGVVTKSSFSGQVSYVRWDDTNEQVESYDNRNLKVIDQVPEANVELDPDRFIRHWAEKLEEFSNSETRVAPYSYIGFIATLLMDYDDHVEALEEEE